GSGTGPWGVCRLPEQRHHGGARLARGPGPGHRGAGGGWRGLLHASTARPALSPQRPRRRNDVARLWLRQRPAPALGRGPTEGRRVRRDRELFRRGLISGAWLPPPTPEPSRMNPLEYAHAWVRSPRLRLGHDSALGRLGFGWYSKERLGGDAFRWTCGHARC